jgi:hypothetical protein
LETAAGAARDEGASVAERVAEHLAVYLGPFNAQVAVKRFSEAALQVPPERLGREHLPALLAALRPVLCTFAGQLSADMLIEKIRREVR